MRYDRRTGLPRAFRALLSISALAAAPLGSTPAAAHPLTIDAVTPSLRSDNSFFLFRDEFDDMQDPARLAPLNTHHLYTLLSNEAGFRYSLGAQTPLGPGGLGLFFSTTGSGSDRTLTGEDFDDETGELLSTLEQNSFTRFRDFNLYAGYGLELGPAAVGLGLRINLSSNRVSVDENVNAGGYNSTFESTDGTTATVTGEQVTRNDQYRLLLSGAFGTREGAYFQGDLVLRRGLSNTTVTMDQTVTEVNDPEDAEDDGSFTGHAEGDLSRPPGQVSGLFIGLELNPEMNINRTLGLEFFGGMETGILDDDPIVFTYQCDDTRSSASCGNSFSDDDELVSTSTVSFNKLNWIDMVAWGAGRARLSPAFELRMGVGYRWSRVGWDLIDTAVTEYTVTNLQDEVSTTVYEESASEVGSQAWSTLFAPVALEILASSKITLRVGAQYTLSSSSSEVTTRPLSAEIDNDPVEFDDEQDSEVERSWTPSMQYSLGLEARPDPRVRLGLMVRSSGPDAPRVSATTGGLAVFGSASLQW